MLVLPKLRKALVKLAKKCPSEGVVEPEEHRMLMDTGSDSNVAQCRKLFPRYKVHPRPNERPQQNCVPPCGTPPEHRGHCNLNVEIGGENYVLSMDDLHVDTPNLCVRRIVRMGNLINIRKGGG